jgi:hypothetical protein
MLGADTPLAAAFAVIVGLLVWVVKAAHTSAEKREKAATDIHSQSLKAWSEASDKDRNLYRDESVANRSAFTDGLRDITTEIKATNCRYRK